MHIIDVNCMNVGPTILGDMIQIVDTTRGRITMRRMGEGFLKVFLSPVQCLLKLHYE